ncbi:MAG: NAD-dependent epimerase/dehydratase family protein [Acidimicrobiales bacterium]
MKSLVVTGAAGSVGRRLVANLVADESVERIVALDRLKLSTPSSKVEAVSADLRTADLDSLFAGCQTLVHLAEDNRRSDANLVAEIISRVLTAANHAAIDHVVVVSSAMVYGAHADNPVPLTEAEMPRPNPEFGFAVAKAALEDEVVAWASTAGAVVSILRPTTTLSEREASWVARSLRTATAVRPAGVDPPVQFLHHDDLVTALATVIRTRLDGVVNVAPDGWIAPDAFRELAGSSQVRVPNPVRDQIIEARRWLNMRPVPDGLDAYVTLPWVVANDRLRDAGWEPAWSNEEAFVIGTAAPPWAVSPSRRQEIALGVAGVSVAALAAAAGFLAKRVTK